MPAWVAGTVVEGVTREDAADSAKVREVDRHVASRVERTDHTAVEPEGQQLAGRSVREPARRSEDHVAVARTQLEPATVGQSERRLAYDIQQRLEGGVRPQVAPLRRLRRHALR